MTEQQIQDLKRIIEDVCNVEFRLRSRQRKYINARAIGYKILRNTEHQSLNKIARYFNKNHATVFTCLKNFKYMLLEDAQMKRNYQEVKRIWASISEEYKDLTPIKIKKQLKYLEEQNKLLNLSLTDVQERYDKRLKELEERLEKIEMISKEAYI